MRPLGGSVTLLFSYVFKTLQVYNEMHSYITVHERVNEHVDDNMKMSAYVMCLAASLLHCSFI